MTERYVLYIPKATEIYLADGGETHALDWGAESSEGNEYDVITVFRVDGQVRTPIAFFWNGQKFVPQQPSDVAAL